MSLPPSLLRDLQARLSPDAVLTDPHALPAYGRDFWEVRGVPGVVVRAARAEDVAATLRLAAAAGVPVVPRAAGTNVGVGFVPTPGCIMLDLRPMDGVIAIDAERRRATVQPGLLNGDLQARLAPLGLCWSPDPASAQISTVGGNIVENAGGPHALKYGNTAHHVQAVTCVLPGGDLLRLTADDTGPDLLGVLIGSEGTLAIVTEATLSLRPLPAVTRTLLAIFDRAEDAVEAVSATIAAGLVPAAMEFFDRTMAEIVEAYEPSGYPTDAEALLLVDLDGSAEEVAADLPRVEAILRRTAREVRRADDDATRDALWRGRLLAAVALTAGGRTVYFGDVTVPREHLPALARTVREVAVRRGLTIVNVGHIGDGNVHPTVLYDAADPAAYAAARAADDEILEAALALGGTLTGEHGVGAAKRGQMPKRFRPPEIAAMWAVKRAFDPAGLLNPGILLPDPAPEEPPLPRFAAAITAAVAGRRAGQAWAMLPTSAEGGLGEGAGIAIDAENLTVTAPAATPRGALRTALTGRGLRCSLAEGDDALSLGAAVAERAADRTAARDSLLAARVRLADGEPARFGSNAVKDVAGYDLKRLFIGSGPAFGVLEEMILRVVPIRGS